MFDLRRDGCAVRFYGDLGAVPVAGRRWRALTAVLSIFAPGDVLVFFNINRLAARSQV